MLKINSEFSDSATKDIKKVLKLYSACFDNTSIAPQEVTKCIFCALSVANDAATKNDKMTSVDKAFIEETNSIKARYTTREPLENISMFLYELYKYMLAKQKETHFVSTEFADSIQDVYRAIDRISEYQQ